jgi:hypothetical protein
MHAIAKVEIYLYVHTAQSWHLIVDWTLSPLLSSTTQQSAVHRMKLLLPSRDFSIESDGRVSTTVTTATRLSSRLAVACTLLALSVHYHDKRDALSTLFLTHSAVWQFVRWFLPSFVTTVSFLKKGWKRTKEELSRKETRGSFRPLYAVYL